MDPRYFAPTELSVTPTIIDRVHLIGGCFFDRWPATIARVSPGTTAIHRQLLLVPPPDDTECEGYDLRLVQIPLRYLYTEYITMEGPYDEAALEHRLSLSFRMLKRSIDGIGGASADRPTLFLNYPMPQRSALGRLLPKYTLANPSFYLQRLNRKLDDLVADYPGGHVLDVEQLAATFGRRLIQDDAFWIYGHGGFIDDGDHGADGARLEPEPPLSQRYTFDIDTFVEAAWHDAVAALRTIRGTDRIKMICIDLDDTLWRGVLAEAEEVDPSIVEGWPLGFAEALMILKQRGMILAIVSKNDEARASDILQRLFVGRVKLEDFPIRRINWNPKPENVSQAIAIANVLPESVLFIDDNPVERAAVERAIPGIRTLGAPHLDWRRILLWSAETQVEAVSEESARRNVMIGAQAEREQTRSAMSDEEFLDQLGASVALKAIASVDAPSFGRALELVNKTNQFNTTGRRWSRDEAAAHFEQGGKWWTFSVQDRFTAYGLVGVVILKQGHVDQYVMSCRVFGLQVEQAALAEILAIEGPMTASLVETERNGPCREVFAHAGWQLVDGVWKSPEQSKRPSHVAVTVQT